MKERDVQQAIEMGDSNHKIYTPIKELPVKAASVALLPRETSSWTMHICADVLRHWEEKGFVLIYDKGRFTDVIDEQYEAGKRPTAEELVSDVIKEGMFREENGYLIPLKPLLSCATGREVTPKTAWWCFVPTHSDVSISLKAI